MINCCAFNFIFPLIHMIKGNESWGSRECLHIWKSNFPHMVLLLFGDTGVGMPTLILHTNSSTNRKNVSERAMFILPVTGQLFMIKEILLIILWIQEFQNINSWFLSLSCRITILIKISVLWKLNLGPVAFNTQHMLMSFQGPFLSALGNYKLWGGFLLCFVVCTLRNHSYQRIVCGVLFGLNLLVNYCYICTQELRDLQNKIGSI